MFQRVTLIGRVGKDPEMRYTPAGTPVTNLSLATTQESPKKDGQDCPKGWKESYNKKKWELTTWWRITVWGQMAEFANQYITKGAVLFVEGEISGEATNGIQNPRVWTGQDGVSRANYEITARTIKITQWGGERENEGDGEDWTPAYDW